MIRFLNINRIARLALLAMIGHTPSALAALYVLAGSPSSYYAVGYDHLLILVQPNQTPRLLRRIGLEGEGSKAIHIDYDSRMIAVEMPRLPPARIELISMDNPGAPAFRPIDPSKLDQTPREPWSPSIAAMRRKTGVDSRDPTGLRYFDSRILLRGGVPWLAMRFTSASGRAILGFPLSLNTAVPETPISISEWTHVLTPGKFGLQDLGSNDEEYGQSRSGRLCHNTPAGQCVDLAMSAPPGRPTTWKFARNRELSIAVETNTPDPQRTHGGDGAGPIFFQRAGAATWTRAMVPGGASEFKLIGQWIIGTAASNPEGRQSPGESQRARTAARRTKKPITQGRFITPEAKFYPGVLFLIDSTTGRQYTLRTNQGDSEILLVEGSTVYYRVNDEIRSVPIQGNTLGQSTLLAKDDDLRDAHWAFTDRK